MAKSDATPAETGGDSQSQTPSGGKQQQRNSEQSTTQLIDFQTGLPVEDATPAETGEGKQEGQQQQASSEDATPAETGDTVTMPREAFNQRLERERQKIQEQYQDYDDLKEAAEKLKEIQGQQEKEEKLLADKLADERARRSALEAELQEARVRSSVVNEAAKMGFVDPSDAYHFIDVAALEFSDAGQPTNVTEQLEALKEAKPYLFARKTMPQMEAANAARGDQPPGKTDADRAKEYFGGGGGKFWQGGGLTVVEQE